MFNVTKRATQGFKPSGDGGPGGGGVPFLVKAAVVGGVVAASLYFLSQRQGGKADGAKAAVSSSSGAEKHEKKDVNAVLQELSATAAKLRPTLSYAVTATKVADDAPVDKTRGQKKVHFVRHGEGYHNVAQREWRQASKPGEPYTIDTDPEFKFIDALLTPAGVEQATALKRRAALVKPQLMVVSPMRRASSTGLIAFEAAVESGALPVVAHELCHETAGKHTCDKRLSRTELSKLYPRVSYSLIETEEDPYWADGLTRETPSDVAVRSSKFIEWLWSRPEEHIVVAAHSGWLLATFNAVLQVDDSKDATWFGTGEMRTMLLTFTPSP